ncbi:helix-turn-helix domain-containing protein [Mesorhizobium sp. M2A.F.Ca.ET.037.01.1.1]|uniref:AraC family transcriptional regulator n=1 Tax=unclassified Mesorhizobium TaxID=325217 RepID=UPI000F75B347|nr:MULTISPECIES: AraC family transcriptional regulator [unclassified Mesorhizobium]RVC67612.1 helix-turn-helix domain-containing protein [Mesorhizobium sp. M00.F.Ca.ET.038.03.1.1]RVC72425.1 helix-turn-helix domain-containing protein [Mesorhizobium sp. M2A.F.Ca.ET.046.02.1.1]AZO39291.1 AraC family transcriptional regulator [Mesorhizobium sp. M2A.F.Ca.ET.046.03.2.1]RUX20299.1 helix-turn-helix domain-containing protein [Mesorhizobium sp. M2A.F.Ca.ET.037.01.1.1]RWA91750.1 MAG: helix-turn-helix dom
MPPSLFGAITAYIEAQGGGQGVFPTPIDSFNIVRSFKERMRMRQVYKPSICIVLQGAKEIILGEDTLRYGAMECLAVGMTLPATGHIVEASPDAPYTGLTLELDVAMIRDVLEQLEAPPAPPANSGPCLFVRQVDDPLAECVLRLLRMCDTPKAVPILFPSVMREICYWLLTGPNGGELCKLAEPESNAARIAKTLHLMHEDIARTLRMEELAEVARMSLSSFHQHFKAMTSMTPLQFQKQLRLLEARRLMVMEDASVADAAYQVGYESASQFSREYSRMFGVAPKRDVMNQQRMYSEYVGRRVQTA